MAKISFKATQGVYLTYKNYPYKAAQVFGEFIDNSIQSFESNKSQLLNSDPHFVLRVDIGFEWAVDPFIWQNHVFRVQGSHFRICRRRRK